MLKLQGNFEGEGGGAKFPLQLQHLQHLQHFPGNVEVLGFLTSASSTFPQFQAIFHQKVLKTGEMLKMLKFAGPLPCTPPPLQNFPLQLQHLQHLQHFPGNVEDCPLTTSTSSTFPLIRVLVLKKHYKKVFRSLF